MELSVNFQNTLKMVRNNEGPLLTKISGGIFNQI